MRLVRHHMLSAFLTSIALLFGQAVPAHAVVLAGVCTVKVTVNYGTIGIIPTMSTVNFSSNPANSTCIQPDLGDLTTTVDLDGTGVVSSTTVKSCEMTIASGNYTAFFGSTFEDSDGSFTFAGNLAEATILLTDMSPTFVGVVELALDVTEPSNIGEIEMCAGIEDGTVSIIYIGTLTFVENTAGLDL